MNDFIKTFESKINEFSALNNAKCSELKHYKRDDISYIEVDLSSFKAIFLTGCISYGYSFFEGNDVTPYNAVIVRLKFDFSDIYFSPYDIHNALGLNKFEILDFHISDGRVEFDRNLDRLFDFIKENRYQLDEFAMYSTEQQKLLDCYMHDLQIASKRIYAKGLEEKTEKRLRSHEINLFYHQALAPYLSEFAEKQSSAKLKKHFEHREKKGKLLLFEQRYFNYLRSHDFQMPDEYTRELLSESTKIQNKTQKLDFLSAVIAGVLVFIFNFAVCKIINNVCLSDYILINPKNTLDSFTTSTVFFIFGVSFFVEKLLSRISKKFNEALTINKIANKNAFVIIILVCIGACVFGGTNTANEAFSVVGLGENDIYYGEGISEQNKIKYDSDAVKFFVIDGYIDDDSQEFVESRDLIFVYKDDFADYTYADLYDEDIDNATALLDEKNIPIAHYKTIDDFLSEYNLE
ncbi:MAG: hypothetical protein ACI4IL_08090 [Eubacterium sp.]